MTHCRHGGGRGGAGIHLPILLVALSQLGLSAACGPGGSVDVLAGDAGAKGDALSGGRGGSDAGAGTGGAATGGVGGASGGMGGSGGAGGGAGTGGTGGSTVGGLDGGPELDPTPVPDAAPDRPAPDLARPPDVAPSPPDMAPMTPDAPSGVNLTMGLITRLKLDEGTGTSTADSAGGGNNGTLNGGAMWIRPGAPGTKFTNPAALRFDGGDDYVEVGTRNMRRNNEAQSVAFWVRYAGAPTGAGVCVSLTQGGAGDGRLKIGFSDSMVRAWKSSGDTLVASAIPAAGWHHYVYTFDGRTHRLYLDGMARGMSTTAADNAPAANVRLGAIHNNAENFQGDLDDVRFYSRALSAAEVAALSTGLE